MFIRNGLFYYLGLWNWDPLKIEKSDLLVAAFWDIQAIIVLLAQSGLLGYFMECLATANHLLSIYIACCYFKVIPSSVSLSIVLFNNYQEVLSSPGSRLRLVMQPQRDKGALWNFLQEVGEIDPLSTG